MAVGGNFTGPTEGDVSGRKITKDAEAGISIDETGFAGDLHQVVPVGVDRLDVPDRVVVDPEFRANGAVQRVPKHGESFGHFLVPVVQPDEVSPSRIDPLTQEQLHHPVVREFGVSVVPGVDIERDSGDDDAGEVTRPARIKSVTLLAKSRYAGFNLPP